MSFIASSAQAAPVTLTSDSSTDTASLIRSPHYWYPPFYTLQSNLSTRDSQLTRWSDLVLEFCRTQRLFRLTTSHAIFTNAKLRRKLAPEDVAILFAHMAERGRAEWVTNAKGKRDANSEEVWIWWNTLDEWATAVADWVDETGQKGTVLTLYELVEGEASRGQVFHGVPVDVVSKALAVLVRRGKAATFGEDEQMGVKIF